MTRLNHIRTTWKLTHYTWFVAIVFVILFLIIELRNWSLLTSYFEATGSVIETVGFALVMMTGLTTLFTLFGALLIVVFASLFSLNMILLYQYIVLQRQISSRTTGKKRTTALSAIGTTAALLGIGCASCGTAILFSLLSLVGAGGLVLWLPLHGQEFSIIGIIGLLYAIWYILGKLENPYMCKA